MSGGRAAYPDGLARFHGIDPGGRFAPVHSIDGFGMDLARASLGFGKAGMRHLDALGVPPAFSNRLLCQGDLARARISMGKSGLFEWNGDEPNLLIGVREFGELVDVVAVRSAAPDEWSLLRGEGWALGHDALFAVREGLATTLRVFGTPFDWMRGQGAGVCMLDWSAHALAELRGLGPNVTLICDDHGAAAKLGAVLAWQRLPKVEAISRRKVA